MLEFFRQHVGGLLGAVVVGMLAVAFALSFGAQSAGWGKGQVLHVKATVDGEDIPETTLRYALNLMGGRGADDEAQRFELQKTALNGLVERQLLVSLAKDMGISAGMDEALDEIAADRIYLTRPIADLYDRLSRSFYMSPDNITAALVEDGHRVGHSFHDVKGVFNLDAYKKFIRNYLQVTEETFEEQQRLELIARRMRQILVSGIRVSTDEVRSQYTRDNDTVVLEYIRYSPDQIGEKLTLSPEAISTFATEHQEEVKQYYETNKFRYTGLEKQVRARHILIKASSTADEATKKGAKERIDALLTRVRAGDDFSALAAQNSEDEGSAKKGGDLGFNPKGRMVAAFDEAMFSLPTGAISDVVETEYGYHIIKVEEIREGDMPIETANAEIAEKLLREMRAKEKAKAGADAALTRIIAGNELEAIAKAMAAEDPILEGLEVLATAPITRSDQSKTTGIGAAPEAAKAAFETDTDPKALQKVFEVRGTYFVGKVKERKQPSDEDFAKQQEELTRSLLAIKQSSFLKDRLAEILSSAKDDGRIVYLGRNDAPLPSAQEGEPPPPAATKSAEPPAPTKSAEPPAPEPPAPTKSAKPPAATKRAKPPAATKSTEPPAPTKSAELPPENPYPEAAPAKDNAEPKEEE